MPKYHLLTFGLPAFVINSYSIATVYEKKKIQVKHVKVEESKLYNNISALFLNAVS